MSLYSVSTASNLGHSWRLNLVIFALAQTFWTVQSIIQIKVFHHDYQRYLYINSIICCSGEASSSQMQNACRDELRTNAVDIA